MINVPPGSSKSTIVSVMWPAWCWGPGNRPDLRFMATAYREDLALRDSHRCRMLIRSEWYQRLWGDKFSILKERDAIKRFDNNKTGYRLAVPTAGIMGEGGDFVCFNFREVIWTEHGPRKIGEIVENKEKLRVWSYCTKTGAIELKRITAWHKNPGREIVRVVLDDGGKLECTPDHKIWTRNRGMVEAQHLCGNDVLPRFAGFDVVDRRPRYTKTLSKLMGMIGRVSYGQNIRFDQKRSTSARSFSRRVPEGQAFGYACPGSPSADSGNGSGANIKTSGYFDGALRTCVNFPDIVSTEFRERVSLAHTKRSVFNGIVNILPARPVVEVGEARIPSVMILVANLLPFWAWANKRFHDQLMNIKSYAFPVFSSVKSRVALMGRRFQHFSSNHHLLACALNDPIASANSPKAGNKVVGEVGDRSPLFIESVGHEKNTYCVTVPPYHTILAGQKQLVVAQCLDDPLSVLQSESDDVRDDIVRKIRMALPSRVRDWERGGAVCINQRLHWKDYTGIVLENEDDWDHLCFPARYEPDHPYPTKSSLGFVDPRTELGEVLCPIRFSEERLRKLTIEMGGEYAASGQYQQRPTPREGGMFKRKNFQFIHADEVPAAGIVVRGWDLAGTKEQTATAETASCRVRMHKNNLYVEHAELFKADPGQVEQAAVDRAHSDGKKVHISIPQDPGQAGKYQAQQFLKRLHGYNARATPEEGAKEARARPLVGQAEAGNIFIVRGPHADLFLDSICLFPLGGKDLTDAFSRSYKHLLEECAPAISFGTARGQF